ncbi:two-component sensor histidine kinase [Embleya scabrispora]|uniref:histidine kinase n=1 Tax=Embleya scabrispora TaxID=159449 RepID=A0A1T3NJZ2_9ACTN|nr:histidine kinase [Embleya scabrispora]OPC77020.1 two-component sensor histidine kinase [Embleya scabrispora]
MRDWRRSRRWTAYGRCALVAMLTVVAVRNGAASDDGRYFEPRSAAVVVCALALLRRREHGWVAPVLTAVAARVWGWPLLPLLLVALFDLAVEERVPAAVVCAAAALGGNALVHPEMSLGRPQQYGSSLFLVPAVVAGLWMGNRHRLVAALHAQVQQLRVERELREQAARTAERFAIAAEMHDVLAHRLSLIALHAGVLATRKEPLPATVIDRLGLLPTASTDALTDLRDVLGALRDVDADADTAPGGGKTEPALRDVEELIEQARTVGQHIDSVVEGKPDHAPAAHRLAVVRVILEALTNARKHAPEARVRIRVDYRAPATLIEVTNSPGARSAPGPVPSGFGLVGLRERVQALGGHLDAGPADVGGRRLAARIPHPAPGGRDGGGDRKHRRLGRDRGHRHLLNRPKPSRP